MDAEGITDDFLNEISSSGDCINSLSNAGNKTLAAYSVNNDINFAFHGVGITLLTLFGISANVLSVIVLTHPKLKSSLTTLLLGLTISDIFVIGTSFLIFSLHAVLKRIEVFPYYSSHIRPHLLPWLLPIALTAQMSSVYFTVIITLERYIAVCHPLKVRSLCTRSTAIRSFFLIVFISILYNIPRWFEYRAVPSCVNQTVVVYSERETEFRKNDNYILYYVNWGYLIVINLVPFTILVYFNIVIYRVAKQHRSRRKSLSPTRARETNEDIQLAGMLLGIVITFLLCNMLALVINVMESFGIGNIANLIPINNFLIICSSSSNFIFYFAFGTGFRRRLKKTLGIKEKLDSRKHSTISVQNATPNIISASLATIASSSIGREDRRPSLNSSASPNDRNNNGDRDDDITFERRDSSMEENGRNVHEYYINEGMSSSRGGHLTVQTVI